MSYSWIQPRYRGLVEKEIHLVIFLNTGLSDYQNPIWEIESIVHEKGVERILKQVCELQFITKEDLLIDKHQFEGICQQKISHRIMCWTCKCLGHFSKDCKVYRDWVSFINHNFIKTLSIFLDFSRNLVLQMECGRLKKLTENPFR